VGHRQDLEVGEEECLAEEEIGEEKPDWEFHGAYMQENEAESMVMCKSKVDVCVGKKVHAVY